MNPYVCACICVCVHMCAYAEAQSHTLATPLFFPCLPTYRQAEAGDSEAAATVETADAPSDSVLCGEADRSGGSMEKLLRAAEQNEMNTPQAETRVNGNVRGVRARRVSYALWGPLALDLAAVIGYMVTDVLHLLFAGTNGC